MDFIRLQEAKKCGNCTEASLETTARNAEIFFDDNYIRENQEKKGIPKCNKCGATIKPDVILYEEPLKDRIVEGALKAITNADLLIIGGTSLTVYPAAGMVRYFNGNKIVLINRDPTQSDDIADLVIHDSIGKILSQIKV